MKNSNDPTKFYELDIFLTTVIAEIGFNLLQ